MPTTKDIEKIALKEFSESKQEELNDVQPEENIMKLKEASQWRMAAIIISWISIISLLILGFAFIGISIVTYSTAALSLGIDMLLDVGTSAAVLWRFSGSAGTIYSKDRERMACLVLGVMFILFSLVIMGKAVYAIVTEISITGEDILLILSIIGALVASLLAVGKFIIAAKLQSISIKSDAFSSLAGGLVGWSILIDALVSKVSDVWYIDSAVSLIVAVLLCLYGIKLLVEMVKSKEKDYD